MIIYIRQGPSILNFFKMYIRKCVIKWWSFIVLKTSDSLTKRKFRDIEQLSSKLVSLESHRKFNESCLINDLLPIYTNVRLYDEAVRTRNFVCEFKKQIIRNEIESQSENIRSLQQQLSDLKTEFLVHVQSHVKYESFLEFLRRIIDSKKLNLEMVHKRKLTKLYHGEIFLKRDRDSVINLSSAPIDESIKRIFNLGMNCHLRTKHSVINKQIEIEKLFKQIKDAKSKKNINISNEEILKCELKRFSYKFHKDYNKDVLTKEEYQAVKQFNSNEEIIVRKADKSNTFVILDRQDFHEKLHSLVRDETIFTKLRKDTILIH